MNLLQETIKIIEENGKTCQDVQWVGSEDGRFAILWDEFVATADFEYDAMSGASQIATDLAVVGSDWWLERHDSEGAEWWEFKTLLQKRTDAQSFDKLIGQGWPSVEAINTAK